MTAEQLMNTSKLTARIAGRKFGEELVELILSESRTHPVSATHPDFAAAVFEAVHKAMAGVLKVEPPKPAKDAPMSYEEAREWERRTKIEFGQHSGSLVKDVPLDYLLWLDGDKFRGELKRYLASPLIQGQQQEREDEADAGESHE